MASYYKSTFRISLPVVTCILYRIYGREVPTMEEENIVVVKLGGSAITMKSKFQTLSPSFDTTMSQIAQTYHNNINGTKLVVVHGAGSFGHFQAKKYAINRGNTYHPDWRIGFADTRRSVTLLNHEVISRLVKEKVPAVCFSIFPSIYVAFDKQVAGSESLSEIFHAMQLGLLPVFHGDAVLDYSQGCSILSGDDIIEELCRSLKPKCAVFVTDVEGVFTLPPTNPHAELIREMIVELDGSCTMPGMMNQAKHDVTGGIEKKLKTAISIVNRFGIPVYIVKAGTEHASEAMAGKEPKVGTIIRQREAKNYTQEK